jgi:gliding motility-associated-like protein
LGTDTFVCSGQVLQLDAGAGFVSYTWNTGETGRVIQVSSTGEYAVLAKNERGCSRADSVRVQLGACAGECRIPSAFSPDNDGRNDRFRALFSAPPPQFQLQVFDRWGRIIFTGNDAADGWNGTVNGRAAAAGVYTYSCRYRYAGRGWQEKKGTVLLLR